METHRWFSQNVQYSFERKHERRVCQSVEEKERQLESKGRHLARQRQDQMFLGRYLSHDGTRLRV